MINSKKITIFFVLLVALFSCQTIYQPQSVKYNDYRVTQRNSQDSNVIQLLKPYADSVNKSMNDVIAVAEFELQKNNPKVL
ncbi:MAG: hypothetical protein IPP48_04295 [Chitinophagaceae bacterium]|nr:hypothetical protein [Chitinophagaceae bacterium]